LIYTARNPIARFWRRILFILFFWALGFFLACVSQVALPAGTCQLVGSSLMLGAMVPSLYALTSWHLDRVRIANRVGAMAFGFVGGLFGTGWSELPSILGLKREPICFLVSSWCCGMAFAASEADVLWGEAARLESDQLRLGYTGCLEDAHASVPQDKADILQEIDSLGLKSEVEHAVEVLMRAGMSTPRLRRVTRHGVDVYGAGMWSAMPLMLLGCTVILEPLENIFTKDEDICIGIWWWAPFLFLSMGCAGFVLFLLQGPDQKGFAAAVAGKCACFTYLAVILVGACGGSRMLPTSVSQCGLDIVGAVFVGPLVLIMMLIGLEGFAAIPTLGPAIVRLVLPGDGGCLHSMSGWFALAAHADDSSDPEDSASPVSSATGD